MKKNTINFKTHQTITITAIKCIQKPVISNSNSFANVLLTYEHIWKNLPTELILHSGSYYITTLGIRHVVKNKRNTWLRLFWLINLTKSDQTATISFYNSHTFPLVVL